MAYRAVPDRPASRTISEAPDDDIVPLRLHSLHNTQLKRLWRMSAANLFLLILQIGLLTIYLSREWQSTGDNYIQGTYGFDTNYMTLSFNYDWLWDKPAIQKAGAIALSIDEDGSVAEYGAISMYIIPCDEASRYLLSHLRLSSGFTSYTAFLLFASRFSSLINGNRSPSIRPRTHIGLIACTIYIR